MAFSHHSTKNGPRFFSREKGDGGGGGGVSLSRSWRVTVAPRFRRRVTVASCHCRLAVPSCHALSRSGGSVVYWRHEWLKLQESTFLNWLVPYLLDTGLTCFGILKFVKLTTWQNAHGFLGHALATGPWEIRAGPGLNRYQKHPKRRRASNESPAQPRFPTLPRATWTKPQ